MSEAFDEKLRRLRKDGASRATSEGTLPAWWRERMVVEREQADARAGVERTLGLPRELRARSNAAGEFAERVTHFAAEHAHGDVRLAEVDAATRATFALIAHDAQLAELDPRRAVYLDIETTGLAGGAGTKAFLVGLGRFDGARFEMWQGFLRGPEEERALLVECAERIRDASAVVSFFGKTFDRHRLEDKMRIHGVRAPFAERAHLDLYHPCRRLFRAALCDGRLATMERALCGVERAGDLPGSFAPAAWYDFLCERPHALEQVFDHNRDDVLSLVTLCARLGQVRERDAATPRLDAARCAGLARSFAREREWAECERWAERAAALAPTSADAETALALLATAQRRLRARTSRPRRGT